MISISLCMIVRDEESVIERCLTSVKDIVDEIVIVDTGSIDNTKSIVSKYTNKIYDFNWEDDFSKARNYSFSKATKDYILWLDADDVILEEDRLKLIKLKNTINYNKVDIIMAPYNVGFDEDGNVTFMYNRERIVSRAKNYKWSGFIHESIYLKGKIIYSDFSVTHKKKNKDIKRNLNIFNRKLNEGYTLCPREEFYYGRELMANNCFYDAEKVLKKFLDDGNGTVENSISACQDLALCYFYIKENNKILSTLTRSFEYDIPRAEVCCDLGAYFMNNNKIEQAIYWYKAAYSIPYNKNNNGFKSMDCYGFLPFVQLCNCYYKLGKIDKAYEYHLKSKQIKPKNKIVNNNEEYFKKIGM